ncbi:MAG: hypothetical protein K0S44_2126 [Bacteroidetes bacterium]|jgi:hypothetical protein|nr:hypothetical protein [Bacteroidota bacterium]
MIFKIMKNLIKISLISAAVVAFASCKKTEFSSFENCNAPVNVSPENCIMEPNPTRVHEVIAVDASGNLIGDKDKCKRCHTSTSRTMGLDLNPPFMSDDRYNTIEELINNYDFIHDVHLPATSAKQGTVSNEQRDALVSYLKSVAAVANK